VKSKTLFIIASDYPYGPGEPFLETELKYISQKFNRIFFLVTTPKVNLKNKILFYLPENSEIIFVNNKFHLLLKILSIKFIFDKLFFSELKIIKKLYKIRVNFLVLKIIFSTLSKADIFLKNLKNILKEKNIEYNSCMFYSYWNNEFTVALTKFKMQYPQITVFSRTHGWDLYFERHNPPYLPFKTFNILHMNAIFTISENGKKYISEKYQNFKFDNVKVSRLGTEPGSFNTGYKRGEVIKILSIAYLAKVKRIELIIDSLAEIDTLSVEWTHIGGGKTYDNLLNYAKRKLRNKTNLKWTLRGNLLKDEIYSLLKNTNYDFLINTSFSEGIPVSMMEAMSFGIPVIGTNVGGVSEIIEDNSNGFLIPSNPLPAEIAEMIKRMSTIPENEFCLLRENAYKTWYSKYNAEVNYKKFAEELEMII
jgi:colanic acid/amylovoran biosynthesis glycosyltransferase